MKTFVVDANVAVKWLIQEVHSRAADELLLSGSRLLAPSFIEIEIGNILWKKVRSGVMAREEGDAFLSLFQDLHLELFPTHQLLHASYFIAVELDRSFYDSLYLALAISQSASLITADKKFYNALQSTSFGSNVNWIEDPI